MAAVRVSQEGRARSALFHRVAVIHLPPQRRKEPTACWLPLHARRTQPLVEQPRRLALPPRPVHQGGPRPSTGHRPLLLRQQTTWPPPPACAAPAQFVRRRCGIPAPIFPRQSSWPCTQGRRVGAAQLALANRGLSHLPRRDSQPLPAVLVAHAYVAGKARRGVSSAVLPSSGLTANVDRRIPVLLARTQPHARRRSHAGGLPAPVGLQQRQEASAAVGSFPYLVALPRRSEADAIHNGLPPVVDIPGRRQAEAIFRGIPSMVALPGRPRPDRVDHSLPLLVDRAQRRQADTVERGLPHLVGFPRRTRAISNNRGAPVLVARQQ